MRHKIIFLLCTFLSFILSARAATYFISPLGDDTQAGTSITQAWRTVDKVNATTFQPGDSVLFSGRQTFAGSITLRTSNPGTATHPIVISSYGSGWATIASGSSYGFYAQNTAGIKINCLNFVGAGRLSNDESGVIFYLDSLNSHLSYLRLDSLNVSGYRNSGISIGSWKGTSGYSDVRITACQVHANGEAGLSSYSESLAAHHNWYVGNCKAFDNTGRATVTTTNTGNGIVLSGIDGALIEHCEACYNGGLNANQSGGPVGIWGYCCNNLIIQYCEAHHNSSGTAPDGGGFDLDGGCTNSVLQYNYSHDNAGPGYELCQYEGAPAMHDLIIRYNVSVNDARLDNKGALQIWSTGSNGGIQRAAIYNNTVMLSPPADGSSPKVVYICSSGFSDLSLSNNVLQSTGRLAVLSTVSTTGLRLEGNCYWNATQLLLDWNGTMYTDLSSWRAVTGQEQLADGKPTGLQADPQLQAAPSFAPLPGSPLRGAGLNLQAEFNISPGPHDYAGNLTPSISEAGNIGALEASPDVASTPATPLPVVLTTFTVMHKGRTALLQWNTASEQDNAHFVVERSLDGHTFLNLATVRGHGTSGQTYSYQYEDVNPSQKAVSAIYYRLQQVDINGKSTYSAVRVLQATGTDGPNELNLQAYPNPTQTATVVTISGAMGSLIQLLDVHGQQLADAKVKVDGTTELSLVNLPAGIYLVRCGPQYTKLILRN
jgi:hypothetical protein